MVTFLLIIIFLILGCIFALSIYIFNINSLTVLVPLSLIFAALIAAAGYYVNSRLDR
ncbi:MAG: hypothetical protein K9L17_10025 [Clostridiales bacterium]|nr:hypothetical protein [Clostridiales bacterium]MCF8023017.1 hypothetical protein [Clostridiales bacterium]